MTARRLIVDPGIGFGKTAEQNLELLRGLAALRVLGCPILLGTSRKSTIGKVLDLPVDGAPGGHPGHDRAGHRRAGRHRAGPRCGAERACRAHERCHHPRRVARAAPRLSRTLTRRHRPWTASPCPRCACEGRLGVSEEERELPQLVEVDVEVEADLAAAGASDALADTVDYGPLVEAVTRTVEEGELPPARRTGRVHRPRRARGFDPDRRRHRARAQAGRAPGRGHGPRAGGDPARTPLRLGLAAWVATAAGWGCQLRGGWPRAQDQRQVQDLISTQHAQGHGLAGPILRSGCRRAGCRRPPDAIHVGDDVALPQAGLVRGAALEDGVTVTPSGGSTSAP